LAPSTAKSSRILPKAARLDRNGGHAHIAAMDAKRRIASTTTTTAIGGSSPGRAR